MNMSMKLLGSTISSSSMLTDAAAKKVDPATGTFPLKHGALENLGGRR